MSEVRILSPDSFGCQLCNFKSEDSIADCHAKRTGENVAEKKAKDNLDPVVVKLKGEKELKDTVNILLGCLNINIMIRKIFQTMLVPRV